MKVGLLSDTHGHLDHAIGTHFKDCDEIWHAGDIGDASVIRTLEKIKPLRAVYGNIDDAAVRNEFPEDLRFACAGVKIWITHIAGTPPGYNERVRKGIKENSPDVLICGHSHILKVQKDEINRLLYINPGAAGQHGFHHMRTVIRMELTEGRVARLEVIELGVRGKI